MTRRRALGVVALVAGAGVVALALYAASLAGARAAAGVIVQLALGALLVGVGWRLLARAPDAEARSEAPTARAAWSGMPVDVPPEDFERREGEMAACIRCGSLDVRPLTLSDGLFPGGGELLAWVCRRCAWRGAPLVFDSATAYREFVKALHEPK